MRGIEAAGYTEPRPIQAKSMGAIIEGRDLLGLAQTGTGKTAAFVLPILDYFTTSKGSGPRALVVAPTRELAKQIHEEFEALGKFTNVRSTVVFGGVKQGSQVRALKSKPQVVVACPGRLLDLYEQGHIDFIDVEILVLDEADHMFDMGFLPAIRKITHLLPEDRQNLFFSATMPKEIRQLADRILHRPKRVELANAAPADTIEHAIFPMREDQKEKALATLIADDSFRSAIVFLRTKHRAKRLAIKLEKQGHQAVALQGNMSQNARTRAMDAFKKGHAKILVATDIAARGLDIEKVSHVINYDVPATPDTYVHRIGRTGRSEQSGRACTFVTRDDGDQIKAIERRLGQKIPRGEMKGLPAEKPRRKGPARPAHLDKRKGQGNPRRKKSTSKKRVSQRGPRRGGRS